jgi:hypothetical protein
MPDQPQPSLYGQLATEEGRDAYRAEYGDAALRDAVKHARDLANEAVRAVGAPPTAPPHTDASGPAPSGPADDAPKRSQMSAREKSDYIAEHGLEKFNALPY